MTLEQILEMLARIDQLNAEELQQLDDAIANLFTEASQVDPPTSESVAQMQQMTEARATVDGEAQARQDAQAELDRQAEELRRQFAGEEPEQPGEGDQPPADPEAPPAEPEAAPPAEGEQPAEPAAPAEPEAAPPAEAPAPEAVAASTPPARRPSPVPLVRLGQRQPAPTNRAGRRSAGAVRRLGLTAAGDLPGFSAGQLVPSWHDLAPGIADKIDGTKGAQGEWRVASLRWEYDDSRMLDGGPGDSDKIAEARRDHAARVESMIASLRSDPSRHDELTAAGGLCAPLAPYYDLMTVSEATRPIRDSLVQFGAARGGITGITPPHLGDLDAAVTQWTIANDAAATAGTPTKPCVRIACGTPWTVNLYAVPLCLEFGVIGARTFPEAVDANNTIGLATHARFAENLLLSQIDAASTAVTDTDTYGAARALLSVLSIMRAGLIQRHRAPQNTKVRVLLPSWGKEWLRTDIARQLATDASESDGGALAVSDAMIDNWLAVRGIVVTWHEDGLAGQVIGAQAAGALVKFPTTIKVRMFFDGGFLFLDGGRLDVGIIRDSTLVSTNDYKTFFEVFEAVAPVGPESLTCTLTASASGASGGTVVAAAP